MELTIFTPTYNRVNLLKKLYKSLKKQTNNSFIWLIVDDGSTDGTEAYIKSISKNAPFEIEYFYQKNSGKHVAHNLAMANSFTDLFFCVDSDDYLLSSAVQIILDTHQRYKDNEYLGYFFRKQDTNGNISGGNFELHNPIIGIRDLYHKKGFQGELAIILNRHLVSDHFFPTFRNESFVSELVYYNELNSIAPMLWINKVIYIFEYQNTGYSKNSDQLIYKNPYGIATGYLSEAHYATKFIDKIKNYAEYKAIIKSFQLDSSLIPNIDVFFFIKICAALFKTHYVKLFNMIKLKYNEQ